MNANTIIITGSNGATASSLMSYFADHYKTVIGISRNPNQKDLGKNIHTLKADISSFKETEDVVIEINKAHQHIDCLINCAGGFDMGKNIEDNHYQWEKMYTVNFITCLNVCKAVIPLMKQRQSGSIINFGSKAAIDGFANAAPYLVSKSAVHALTKIVAIETKDDNIRCNAILPGIIDTPANRDAMPDEDFAQWETPNDIARKAHQILQSSISGELITLNQEI